MMRYGIIITAMLVMLLPGCAVTNKFYKGPDRPPGELSIINQLYVQEATNWNHHYQFILSELDGKPVGKTEGIAGIELLPGEYTFGYKLLKVINLPTSIYHYKETVSIKVTTRKGKKGFVAFKNKLGGPGLCMYFSDIDKPYPHLVAEDFPPSKKYEPVCADAGIDISEASWREHRNNY